MGEKSEGLTGQQEQVLTLMLSGQTQKAAAVAVGVVPETVSRWLSGDALFVATLNARRQELWDVNRDKLQELAAEAVEVLGDVLRGGVSDAVRLRAAVAVLRALGLANGARPDGATRVSGVKADWGWQSAVDSLTW